MSTINCIYGWQLVYNFSLLVPCPAAWHTPAVSWYPPGQCLGIHNTDALKRNPSSCVISCLSYLDMSLCLMLLWWFWSPKPYIYSTCIISQNLDFQHLRKIAKVGSKRSIFTYQTLPTAPSSPYMSVGKVGVISLSVRITNVHRLRKSEPPTEAKAVSPSF